MKQKDVGEQAMEKIDLKEKPRSTGKQQLNTQGELDEIQVREQHTQGRSELLEVNMARKLEWSSDLEEEVKKPQNAWETFDMKKLRKAAVPLDFIPPEVMDSFYQRIWKNLGIDKVVMLPNGLFVVRFHNMEGVEEALTEPIRYLGSNPVVIKRWSVEKGANHKEITHVPVWIQLHSLELKYWNPATLSRIASTLGRPIAADDTTVAKDRATFGRVLVDVEIQESPPLVAHFADEEEHCRKKVERQAVQKTDETKGEKNNTKSFEWRRVGKKKINMEVPEEEVNAIATSQEATIGRQHRKEPDGKKPEKTNGFDVLSQLDGHDWNKEKPETSKN
ncbi:OLC1v1015836C1 [Oldenlandia corymbosa var. corymbosa]|uniref:OLC1v1015836C1 n=1 Tax=Oldenlandia corymbosa var. corymbosa TaxID=529605 RepID=A0AAV1E718_OLDCO|nr:OLC1v1015836C1 [Oldenlandia corymbosa var. corymbosa]